MDDEGGAIYSFSWRNSLFLKFAFILLMAFLGFFLAFTLLHLWNFNRLEKDLNRREIQRLKKGVNFVLNKEECGVRNLLQSLLWNKELRLRVQKDDLPWLQAVFAGEMTRPFASAGVIDNRGKLLYAKRSIFKREDLQDLVSFLRQGRKREKLITFSWRHRGNVYLVGIGDLFTGDRGRWLYLAKELNKGYLVGLRHFSEGEIEIFPQTKKDVGGLTLRDWRKRPVAWISIRPSTYFVSLFVVMERIYL